MQKNRSRFALGDFVRFRDPNVLNYQIQGEIFKITDVWEYNSTSKLYTYRIEHIALAKLTFTTSESNLLKLHKNQSKIVDLIYGKA